MSVDEKVALQAEMFGDELWEAWLDGKKADAVEFLVPAGYCCDIAEEGARALDVELCEELNVRRIRS